MGLVPDPTMNDSGEVAGGERWVEHVHERRACRDTGEQAHAGVGHTLREGGGVARGDPRRLPCRGYRGGAGQTGSRVGRLTDGGAKVLVIPSGFRRTDHVAMAGRLLSETPELGHVVVLGDEAPEEPGWLSFE